MRKKGFIDISFGWVFALVVGAFILFLAIFVSVKIIKTESDVQGAEVSKDLGIVLDPLETGFEESKTTSLELGVNSEIQNICEAEGDFGKQRIKTSQEIFGKQEGGDVGVVFYNKYIFSENPLTGKVFYIFSKKFEFPFKIADLVFIIPKEKNYCFVQAPENIENMTRELKLSNIVNASNINNCPQNSEKVCFTSGISGCDVKVNLLLQYTEKNNKKLYFNGDALMYGTIFSDKDLYECQLKRIMKRLAILSTIYEEKKDFVSLKNCNSIVDFTILSSEAKNYNSTENLNQIAITVQDLKTKNGYAQCSLW
jgi:hypothetical protein